MKPRLVHNWPHVKEENDELSSKILDLANNYTAELKERKKHREENATELSPVLNEEENHGKN